MRFLRRRRPCTVQERRANGKRDILYIDEYQVRLRAKRNMANLVNSWDDIFRGDLRDRSWKRHRKTQWKG